MTRIVETPISFNSKILSVYGTMGSFFTSLRIALSRIIKFVALVSSSMSRQWLPP